MRRDQKASSLRHDGFSSYGFKGYQADQGKRLQGIPRFLDLAQGSEPQSGFLEVPWEHFTVRFRRECLQPVAFGIRGPSDLT